MLLLEVSKSLASLRSDPSLKFEFHPVKRQKDKLNREISSSLGIPEEQIHEDMKALSWELSYRGAKAG
jgi:hypothetical protein